MWKDRLHAELGGRTPDYLVVHHMEPDHAALIAETVAEFPEITVVASAKALAMIPLYFENFSAKTLAVKEGDVLELGSHSLHFIAAPMVHWPEVIMSYEPSEKVLFSDLNFMLPPNGIEYMTLTKETGPAKPAATIST